MKKVFLNEVNLELKKTANLERGTLSEMDIAHLPNPVRKYFRYCGFLGKEEVLNGEVCWDTFFLKLAPEKGWLEMQCQQFNSVPDPSRFVFMKSKWMGFLSLEGRDKYLAGEGNMLIKLMKLIKISDAKGKEMNEGALVTLLAEAVLIPGYCLMHYITWKTVDELTAHATIVHHNLSVSGTFHFNEKGEFVRFETNDRYLTEKGSLYRKTRWSIEASEYREKGGVKFPSKIRGFWHFDEGDFQYFKGEIGMVKYNISKW